MFRLIYDLEVYFYQWVKLFVPCCFHMPSPMKGLSFSDKIRHCRTELNLV